MPDFSAVSSNIRVIIPFLVVSWGLFLLFTIIRPQHFRNSVFILSSLFFSLFFIAGLTGDHMGDCLMIMAICVFVILLLVPVMLIFNGISMLRHESKSLPNLLSLLLGIVIGIGEICFITSIFTMNELYENRLIGAPAFFIGASVFYFSCWVLAFVFYVISIQVMPHRRNFDYVIIHGCGLINGERVSKLLANRTDRAIELYNKSKVKPILIPSGGKGDDENLSEAQAIKNYLLEHGIPEEHIIIEDRSTTTLENLKFSFEIINSRDGGKKTALVSSNYHTYRCILYASSLKLKCTGIGAKVAPYYWPSATIREFAAVFTRKPHVYWIAAGYILFTVIPAITLFFIK